MKRRRTLHDDRLHWLEIMRNKWFGGNRNVTSMGLAVLHDLMHLGCGDEARDMGYKTGLAYG